MNSNPKIEDELRDRIIAEPMLVLENPDVMRALIEANQLAMGGNVVDLRGISMERLEARFDRLEDTHRGVVATAYENLAGTNQVHRGILRLLDAPDLDGLIGSLDEVASILGIDCLRLILEPSKRGNSELCGLDAAFTVAEPGFIEDYSNCDQRRKPPVVILRRVQQTGHPIYADVSETIRSEACLRMRIGSHRRPGMLVMGCRDPRQFSPQQGTQLLTFFAGVFERALCRWLS